MASTGDQANQLPHTVRGGRNRLRRFHTSAP